MPRKPKTNLDVIGKEVEQLKIGIMGGAFDPPTLGHIQVARLILRETNLNEVWLMPCYNHAADKKMTDPNIRYEMCKLAIENETNMHVLPYEIQHKIEGGTFQFVKRFLRDIYLAHIPYEFSYIIGMDNADNFAKWKHSEALKKAIRFIVVPRKGVERKNKDVWYEKDPHTFVNVTDYIIEISSTEIRNLIKENNNKEANNYLDKKVSKYINSKGLYRKCGNTKEI